MADRHKWIENTLPPRPEIKEEKEEPKEEYENVPIPENFAVAVERDPEPLLDEVDIDANTARSRVQTNRDGMSERVIMQLPRILREVGRRSEQGYSDLGWHPNHNEGCGHVESRGQISSLTEQLIERGFVVTFSHEDSMEFYITVSWDEFL